MIDVYRLSIAFRDFREKMANGCQNMKQLTINIADNKFEVFLEFIKTLDYVKVEDGEEKALEELQSSLMQVKLMKEGRKAPQAIDR